MKTLIHDAGLEMEIDSAGTHNYNVGSPPDSRAFITCQNFDVDISAQRARQITQEDLSHFDYIFTMDNYNLQNLLELAKHEKIRKKIIPLKNYIYSEEIEQIPDPYNEEEEYFEKYKPDSFQELVLNFTGYKDV